MKKRMGYDVGIGAAHGVEKFEEACGRGSYPRFNEEYCKLLLKQIKKLNVKKIVDYGCGNLECYKGHIDWSKLPFEYIGYDVNENCLKELNTRYSNLTFKQVHLKELPEPADVLIIKDVLIHWFDPDIKWFFENVFSNFKYVIYTHFTTNQGYPHKDHRCPPNSKYGVELQNEHFYGCRTVPLELLPKEKILFKKNLLGDAWKTFIVFGDK